MSKRLRRIRFFFWLIFSILLLVIFLFPPMTYSLDFEEEGVLGGIKQLNLDIIREPKFKPLFIEEIQSIKQDEQLLNDFMIKSYQFTLKKLIVETKNRYNNFTSEEMQLVTTLWNEIIKEDTWILWHLKAELFAQTIILQKNYFNLTRYNDLLILFKELDFAKGKSNKLVYIYGKVSEFEEKHLMLDEITLTFRKRFIFAFLDGYNEFGSALIRYKLSDQAEALYDDFVEGAKNEGNYTSQSWCSVCFKKGVLNFRFCTECYKRGAIEDKSLFYDYYDYNVPVHPWEVDWTADIILTDEDKIEKKEKVVV